ncbi:PREDICTED: uncharacterized protein LOC108975864 [Bactrocera latifrons]|uniref:Uncharacterized protein n=1 Tax=Bactrocera latifrons TaxID=174628 RepID=A0A0K8UYV5_BACLA|nr:PREDICTED: uncharacterized protein LOC108975864 [Bactrocera latifrons]
MAKIEKQKEIISITHFINPHLFWYHKIDACSNDYHSIHRIEKELAEFYNNHKGWQQAIRRPQLNTLVAVKFLTWNKLIRARVDHIASYGKNVVEGQFIMWAVDYGFPFQTKADHIFRLPNKLTTPVDYIRCGGLANVVPAEEFFMKNTMVKKVSKKWHQRAYDIIEKAINDSECIVFTKEFTFDNHDWGELVIKTNIGVKYRVKDHLISLHLATETESNFSDECQKLKTTKIAPWMCNNGNSKFYTNRAYIFPGVVGITHNPGKFPELTCDIKAKEKVDDWYERNRFKSGQETEFLDSTNEFMAEEDNNEKDFENIEKGEAPQHIQLAGILSKSRAEKSDNGHISAPPVPDGEDFEMSPESKKCNRTMETIESEISSIRYLQLENSTANTLNFTSIINHNITEKSGLDKSVMEAKGEMFSKQNEIEDHNKSDPTLGDVSAYARHLITFRKEYIDRKMEEETLKDTDAYNFAKKDIDINRDYNLKLASTTRSRLQSNQEVTSVNSTFHGLRMIPAGYDFINLCDYKDEEHWHCKKSTLNDRTAH